MRKRPPSLFRMAAAGVALAASLVAGGYLMTQFERARDPVLLHPAFPASDYRAGHSIPVQTPFRLVGALDSFLAESPGLRLRLAAVTPHGESFALPVVIPFHASESPPRTGRNYLLVVEVSPSGTLTASVCRPD